SARRQRRPSPPLFPYTTLFRSEPPGQERIRLLGMDHQRRGLRRLDPLDGGERGLHHRLAGGIVGALDRELRISGAERVAIMVRRSEEHTSELQSLTNLVCRLLL